MCFSANASFGAGIVVAAAGIVSTLKVKHRDQFMFAAIPLIFAAQQMMEGWVWLTFTHNVAPQWQRVPVTVFLFLAQVLWPVWVPFSILKIEPDSRHSFLLRILAITSLVLAPVQAFRLVFYPPTVDVTMYHIHYGFDFSIPYFGVILNMFYLLTTSLPPFVSSRKPVVILGVLNMVALVITLLAFRQNIVSVWCFFAALISCQVIQTLHGMNAETNRERQ